MKAALILIDIQNDFVEKGVFNIEGATDVIPIINDIRSKYDQKFSSIFLVNDQRQETHISFKDSPYAKEENLPFDEITLGCKGKFPRYCVKGTQGAALYYEMMVKGNEITITKGENKFKEEMSAFNNQMFRDILKSNNIDTVFICGFTTEFSVGLTALDCARKEYKTYVIKEACKGFAPASEAAMLRNFRNNKVDVISYNEFEKIISGFKDVQIEKEKDAE
jgi:nicotinamidase/pyrazinamidase